MAQDSQDLGPQLCMRRPTLDDLPEIVLPDGYSPRASREGDGPHWARIVRESFGDASYDESRFKREMQDHPNGHKISLLKTDAVLYHFSITRYHARIPFSVDEFSIVGYSLDSGSPNM